MSWINSGRMNMDGSADTTDLARIDWEFYHHGLQPEYKIGDLLWGKLESMKLNNQEILGKIATILFPDKDELRDIKDWINDVSGYSMYIPLRI